MIWEEKKKVFAAVREDHFVSFRFVSKQSKQNVFCKATSVREEEKAKNTVTIKDSQDAQTAVAQALRASEISLDC